jgi:hypothetical protein
LKDKRPLTTAVKIGDCSETAWDQVTCLTRRPSILHDSLSHQFRSQKSERLTLKSPELLPFSLSQVSTITLCAFGSRGIMFVVQSNCFMSPRDWNIPKRTRARVSEISSFSHSHFLSKLIGNPSFKNLCVDRWLVSANASLMKSVWAHSSERNQRPFLNRMKWKRIRSISVPSGGTAALNASCKKLHFGPSDATDDILAAPRSNHARASFWL